MLTATLQLGYSLQDGDKLLIGDVSPAEFAPTSLAITNCRLVTPTSGVKITSCQLLSTQAILDFEVTFGTPQFLQIEIDNFMNPPSVKNLNIEIVRYSLEGEFQESTFGLV